MVHNALKSRRSISQAKGHDLELIVALVCFECCFMLIGRQHPDLVISRSHVQLSEYFGASQLIQDFLNDRHGKLVLDCNCI